KIHKPPQLDEALHGKLYQLTKEFDLAYIFYYPEASAKMPQILIVAFENKNVEEIESRKWIRNSMQDNEVVLHVISFHKMMFTYKKGNPFIAYYCQQNFLIYQNQDSSACFETDWKSFKKKYRRYT